MLIHEHKPILSIFFMKLRATFYMLSNFFLYFVNNNGFFFQGKKETGMVWCIHGDQISYKKQYNKPLA